MTIYGAIPRGAYRQQARRQPRSYHFERSALGLLRANNSHITCASDPSMDVASITIEVMVRYHAWGFPSLLHRMAAWSADGYYVGGTGAPVFIFETVPGSRLWIGTPTLGEWCHFVVVQNALVYKRSYFNAVLDNELLAPAAIVASPAGTNLEIGTTFGGISNSPTADIAFVRVYNIALIQEEIRWNMLNYNNPVHPGNLVLWLPMEEGTGLVAADHSGLGNNGALLPAPTPPTWERVKQYELRAETEQ